jgi:carbon starvation protein CstA
MTLALATLYALRYRWRLAIPLAWVFVVATVLDLSNVAVMGIREDLFDKATDVSWLILTFYVPALWVSVVLVAWRLWMREGSGSLAVR